MKEIESKGKKNAVIVHHSVDLDGWFGAAVCRLGLEHLGFSPIVLGYNYDKFDIVDDILTFEPEAVVLVDCTLPVNAMVRLAGKFGEKLIWLDHHKKAVENIRYIFAREKKICTDKCQVSENINAVSGCEIAMDYFNQKKSKWSNLIEYIGLYDSWRFASLFSKGSEKYMEVLYIQMYLRTIISSVEEACSFLLVSFNLEDAIAKGKFIFQFKRGEVLNAVKSAKIVNFTIEENTYTFALILGNRMNPDSYNIDICDYHPEVQGTISLTTDSGVFVGSIYSKVVDCAHICMLLCNGGGHKGAAGFRLTKDSYFWKILFS